MAAASPVPTQTWPAVAHAVDEDELVAQPLVVANVLGDAKHLHADAPAAPYHTRPIRRALAHRYARRRPGARARACQRSPVNARARAARDRHLVELRRLRRLEHDRRREVRRGHDETLARVRIHHHLRAHAVRCGPHCQGSEARWLVPHGAGDTWSAVPSTVADSTVTAVPLRCGRASIAISTYLPPTRTERARECQLQGQRARVRVCVRA